MTDNRSPEEIERQLERERAGLSENLEDLRDKFSVDTIIRQTADQIREHSGDIGASVSRAVKENPLAIAVTGVGLAWLIFGDRSGRGSAYGYDREDRQSLSAPRFGGRRTQSHSTGQAVHDSDVPAWARSVDDMQGGTYGTASRTTGTHSGTSETEGAGKRLADASGAVRSKLHDTAASVQDRAAALRERLSEGTEHMTEEARERVVAAREKAHEAREAAMDRMRQGREKAADLFQEQPLIAGALAMAVGAAIGAALPHTRFEDEHFGKTSDELIRDAERIFAEERAKFETSLKQGAADATAGSRDTSQTGAPTGGQPGQTGAARGSAGADPLTDQSADRSGGSDSTTEGKGRGLPGDIPS